MRRLFSLINFFLGAIIGGYVYFGKADERLLNHYIFTDVSFSMEWDETNSRYGTVGFKDSKLVSLSPGHWNSLNGPIDSQVSWVNALNVKSCSKENCPNSQDTPVKVIGSIPIHSFGLDNEENLYFVGPNGLFRLVSPGLCNITINNQTEFPTETPTDSLPIIYHDRTILRNPIILENNDKNRDLFEVTLTIKPALWNTSEFEFFSRSYNGIFPGPTIAIYPGSTLRLNIILTYSLNFYCSFILLFDLILVNLF
jgi:hypothetical protein